jgi:hypothetical protein
LKRIEVLSQALRGCEGPLLEAAPEQNPLDAARFQVAVAELGQARHPLARQ